jgi:hypothetical protein
MEMGGQHLASWEELPDTRWIGGWVDLKAGLDAVAKRKISLSCPCLL